MVIMIRDMHIKTDNISWRRKVSDSDKENRGKQVAPLTPGKLFESKSSGTQFMLKL